MPVLRELNLADRAASGLLMAFALSATSCETAKKHAAAGRAAADALPSPENAIRLSKRLAGLSIGAAARIERNPAGASNLPATTNGCPTAMARIGGYCIDRFEATVVEVSEDNRAIAHPSSEQLKRGVRYEARSTQGVLPQAYVSRVDAAAACETAGKRLCSVREWYGACRGGSNFAYPYGDRFVKGKCNTGKLHLLSIIYGSNPRSWKYESFNNPQLNLVPGFLAHTREYSECTNDYGVYDMVGNLHEWVSDSVDHSLELDLRLMDGVRRAISRHYGNGVFMGGFYSTSSQQGHGCGYVTIAHGPRYHDYSTGFRCCADAQ